MSSYRLQLSFLVLCFLFLPGFSQQLPEGFTTVPVVSGLVKPTAMAFAPDGRLFVTEQAGAVRIIKNGTLLATPFMKLKVSLRGEGGLLGIAFDPDFATNQLIYFYYTLPNESNNRISVFRANGDVVVSGSEKVIWVSDSLSATIHHGGALRFKGDKLYAAVGDNYNPTKAQDLRLSHGKVIRINRDGTIPAGNPFTSGTTQQKKIWAYGFRNPFSFDIDPLSGRVFVNDVGYNKWEEINEATTAGKNYGWPIAEGASTNSAYTNAISAYNHGHNDEFGCAITGGAFFNPARTSYPSSFVGKYFYNDFCAGWIRVLNVSGPTATVEPFATGLGDGVVGLTTGTDGNIYYMRRATGSVMKIIYSTNNAPLIAKHPTPVTASQGQPATFTVTATGHDPLKYQWQKNGVNITGAIAESYTIDSVTTAHAGTYRCKVSNAYGTVYSNGAQLTVTAYNEKPVATLTAPVEGTLYRAGENIYFAGTAHDKEDGELSASRFTWYVDFYHDTHNHAGPPAATGVRSGTFTVPTRGEVSDTVWYRVTLIVADSKGLTDTTWCDVHPRKSVVTLTTQPAGLQVQLDGYTLATPYNFTGVEMVERSIGSVSPQSFDGKSYEFSHWLHGGAATQTISTPVNDYTYTAVYKETSLRPAVNPTNVVNGLAYRYYEGKWSVVPSYAQMTPVKTGTVANFDLTPQNRPDQFGFSFSGYIDVPADGEYTLYTSSDDGSRLYIGDVLVVNNDGLHSMREASGKIGLQKGKHPLRVDYFENGGSNYLQVRYEGVGMTKRLVPASALYRDNATTTASATTQTQARVASEQQLTYDSDLMTFYPNPAHHEINLHVMASSADIILVVIRNELGEIVMDESFYSSGPGKTTLKLTTSGLAKGLYYLECFNGMTTDIERLMIK